MIDIVEILIHWYAGRSQNELGASLGVDRKTVRKYTAPARGAGIEPGGPHRKPRGRNLDLADDVRYGLLLDTP